MEENKELPNSLIIVWIFASIFFLIGVMYFIHSTVESFSNWIGISYWWVYGTLGTLLLVISRVNVTEIQALLIINTIPVIIIGLFIFYWVIYWFIQFGGWFYDFIMRI